jgi:hypothetical protein
MVVFNEPTSFYLGWKTTRRRPRTVRRFDKFSGGCKDRWCSYRAVSASLSRRAPARSPRRSGPFPYGGDLLRVKEKAPRQVFTWSPRFRILTLSNGNNINAPIKRMLTHAVLVGALFYRPVSPPTLSRGAFLQGLLAGGFEEKGRVID